MKRVIILFVFLAVSIFAQVENSGKMGNPYSVAPRFYIDVAAYPLIDSSYSRIDVFLKIPFSSLQFVKNNEEYNAGYETTLSFYDEDEDEMIFQKVWSDELTAPDFNSTTSKSIYNLNHKKFNLKPDLYVIKCSMEDKHSKKSFQFSGTINIKNYNNPVEVSDVIFIEDTDDKKIIPIVSNIFTNRDKNIEFFFEVKTEKQNKYFVTIDVFNEEEKPVKSEKLHVSFSEGLNYLQRKMQISDLSLGVYKLVIRLYNDNDKLMASTIKEFSSRIYGFPGSITNLDKAVDQMRYIANDSVIDSIKESTSFEEKLQLYMDYWKTKDPSPNTEENEVLEEYYRRVDYANIKFKNYTEGWRTDMGMIYIILGAPDQVERHPFSLETKPYEIWEYYEINRRFVFMDNTGFGDYRLLNPTYGDLYRYRD